MKKWILPIFFGLSLQAAQAQLKAEIKEETRAMSLGSFNCLVVDLPGTAKKTVIDLWEDHAKSFKAKKTKYDKKTDEIFTDDAVVKDISPNTIDIFAKVTETANGTQLSVWYNVGLNYLSSREFPQQYVGGEKIVQDFVQKLSSEILESELKEQEKAMSKLQDDLKKLEKEKTSKEKDIEENRKAIQKAEDAIKKSQEEIQTNEGEQGAKKKEIETQTKIIDDLNAKIKEAKGKKR